MGGLYASWQEMEKLIDLWYRLVARKLRLAFQASTQRCQYLEALLLTEQELKQRARAELAQLNLESQKERERADLEIDLLRSQNPMVRALDRVRHRASQQRIRDLSYEIENLRVRLRKALCNKD
jgi:hypothetical protein